VITFRLEGKRLIVDQHSTSPFVYLDHAPLMEVAERHAERFASALQSRGGTLAFTWLHLVEASKVSDQTANLVEELLLRIGREHLVLLRVRPAEVIAQEDALQDALRQRLPLIAPHLDSELATAQFQNWKKGQIEPFDLRGLIHALRSPETARDIAKLREETYPEVIDAIKRNAAKYRDDREARRLADAPSRGPRFPQPTRYINREAGRYLIRNGERLATFNDVDDCQHAVVSLSYCNLVVLDKNWKEAARQIQARVRAAGLLTHEARVFKVAELPQFLDALETPS
jgi:hypothetical protein